MLKKTSLLILIFCILFLETKAQNYFAAIGTRLGYGLGISGKWSPNQNLNFLEGMLKPEFD